MTQAVHVRYFAAAADAAGIDEERIELTAGSTINDLRNRLGSTHGDELARVLELCSFLLDGQAAEPSDLLGGQGSAEARVDILPPFAGG